tara:strand:+ start:159 stop:518 length:360 start_codon:yes stop_codon:yes gene_type:complete
MTKDEALKLIDLTLMTYVNTVPPYAFVTDSKLSDIKEAFKLIKHSYKWDSEFIGAVQLANPNEYNLACEVADMNVPPIGNIECHDCLEFFPKEQIIPWRYETDVKLCDNCTENRDDDEE